MSEDSAADALTGARGGDPQHPQAPTLRGLGDVEAARAAVDVLASIPWDGTGLDPDSGPAGSFLARL